MGRQFTSPTGSTIKGTVEVVYGCARISDIDENGIPVHTGESDIYYDGMETQLKDGKVLFMDQNGEEWTFDQLTAVPDDE
jgi:hypothetical protein